MAEAPPPLRLGAAVEDDVEDIAANLAAHDASKGRSVLPLFFLELTEAYEAIAASPRGYAFYEPPLRRYRLESSGFLVIYEACEDMTLVIMVVSERRSRARILREARQIRRRGRTSDGESRA